MWLTLLEESCPSSNVLYYIFLTIAMLELRAMAGCADKILGDFLFSPPLLHHLDRKS